MSAINYLEELTLEYGPIELRLAKQEYGTMSRAGVNYPGAVWVAQCGGATGVAESATGALNALLEHAQALKGGR